MPSSPSRPITVVRHRPFGPPAIAVAKFLVAEGLPPSDSIIAALHEIHRRHPALSFRDFMGAAVLAQALSLDPEGSA
jgi:hypothetical protein